MYIIFTPYIVSKNKITNKTKKNRTLMALVEVYGGQMNLMFVNLNFRAVDLIRLPLNITG